MLKRDFVRVKCKYCNHFINTKKSAGSWVVCSSCRRGFKMGGDEFVAKFSVRCRRCGNGFVPTRRGMIVGRVCDDCRRLEGE